MCRSAVFSACRQPGMGLSEFALRACEDMLPEYKSSWDDNMTQVLVNMFIALMGAKLACN